MGWRGAVRIAVIRARAVCAAIVAADSVPSADVAVLQAARARLDRLRVRARTVGRTLIRVDERLSRLEATYTAPAAPAPQ